MSNANKVREIIATAKAAGAIAMNDEIIADVRAATGFTRQLARAYVKGNWDKAQAQVQVEEQTKAQVQAQAQKN